MRLVIESDRYDHLATWPVDVPLDGTRVELEAPRIVVEDYPLSAPVGPWTLRAQAHDDRRIDHVVLYADGHKVAWAGGGSPRAELVAPVDLHYGSNRLTVVAEDDQGLTGRYYFVVRGETEASVDAIEVGPDDDTP